MSKSLFLLRHAKAMTGGTMILDQDRALSEKGFKDAHKLASKLAKKDLKLDLILSSSAVRAITTAQILANGLKPASLQLLINDELYSAEMTLLLKIISKFPKKIDKLMIVGHNPGLTNLASFVVGEPIAMSTCSLIKLTFEFKEWHEIANIRAAKFNFLN